MRSLAHLAAAAVLAVVLCPPLPARAEGKAFACNDITRSARLAAPLAHMRRLVGNGKPVTIVALGSSSTAGAGASTPASSYPSRLEAELRQLLPRTAIKVINRGANGDEVAGMLARFDATVASDRPDVVLWQLGTNTVLRDNALGPVDRLIQTGLARIQAHGADVVLIDPQFAPKVIVKHDAEEMVAVIAADAMRRGVDLFPRFAIMRGWREVEHIPFETFLSPDLLHMNDWGYACFAKLLGGAIAEAATRPITAARTTPPR